MTTTLVYVTVKEEFIEPFKKACEQNHSNSVNEPGNLRFDILQHPEDPSKFILYEAYVNEAAAAAHKETPHYAEWRDTVKDWMTEPRKGVRYNVLYPAGHEA